MSEIARAALVAGDVVRLKSGGPPMTVEFEPSRGCKISTVWFTSDGELHRGQVDSVDDLIPAEPMVWK